MSRHSIKYLKNYSKPDYYISRTDLHFDIFDTYTIVKTQYSVYRSPESSERAIRLDGENLELMSVRLDGRLLNDGDYKCDDFSLTIYNVPEKFILDIKTNIKPDENKALAGLYRSKSILVTQCEPHGFRRITYSLDRPDISSIYTTSIIASAEQYPVLLSNGDKQLDLCLENNRRLVVWHDPFPKPSYLFALVAGDLACVKSSFSTMSNREISLELYVSKGAEDQCEFALEAVKKAMLFDEQQYSREYDLDTFMIVATEDFNFGAMENKGLNIFNISCINTHKNLSTDTEFLRVASVIGHEYFHNWSGNRVTCRDWFQLSLKEGLTVYRENQFMESVFPVSLNRVGFINKLLSRQFAEDAGPLAHPVQPDSYIEVNNFYTATIYEKGAEVIRMMHTLIGDDNYFKGISNYFDKFDGACATIEDFVACMENSSGFDLSQFKNWYKQKGTPTVKVRTLYDSKNKCLDVNVKQIKPFNDENTHLYPLVIPIKVAVFDNEGNKIKASYKDIQSSHHLFVLKDKESNFHLDNVKVEPTVSLLQGLSAPVKLDYDYSVEDLSILLLYEKDQYNRWDAAVRLHKKELFSVLKNISRGSIPVISEKYLSIIKELLSLANDQKMYNILGNLLQLPKITIFTQELEDINIEHIYSSYQFIQSSIYQNHRDIVDNIFETLQKSHFDRDIAVAKRILQNTLLDYIIIDKSEKEVRFLSDLISATDNITEHLSIMSHLCSIDSPLVEEYLNKFYDKWKNSPLTYDKWIKLLSGSNSKNVYERITRIKQEDPNFIATNPNHIRALYGYFSMENLVYFHARDGKGYELVVNEILEVDKFNPNLSSVLVSVFSNWKKFAKENQNLMQKYLQTILDSETISKNLFEMTEKMLS
jgi:aminopeptidase N